MFKRKVKLPTTLDEFDKLSALIVKKYKLTDPHHAAAILSVAIRHIPNDEAYTTLDYLGHSILKNIANYVANHRGDTLRQKAQIDALAAMVKADPNNQQAWDELEKIAADSSQEGAKDARKAILQLEADLKQSKEESIATGAVNGPPKLATLNGQSV